MCDVHNHSFVKVQSLWTEKSLERDQVVMSVLWRKCWVVTPPCGYVAPVCHFQPNKSLLSKLRMLDQTWFLKPNYEIGTFYDKTQFLWFLILFNYSFVNLLEFYVWGCGHPPNISAVKRSKIYADLCERNVCFHVAIFGFSSYLDYFAILYVWPQVLALACSCMTDGSATLFSPCICSFPFSPSRSLSYTSFLCSAVLIIHSCYPLIIQACTPSCDEACIFLKIVYIIYSWFAECSNNTSDQHVFSLQRRMKPK